MKSRFGTCFLTRTSYFASSLLCNLLKTMSASCQEHWKIMLHPMDERHDDLLIVDNSQQQQQQHFSKEACTPSTEEKLHKIVLGRTPSTKITDKRCSREQMHIWADMNSSELVIQQLGSNQGCLLYNNNGIEIFLEKFSTKRIAIPSQIFSLQTSNDNVHKHDDKSSSMVSNVLATVWLLGLPQKEYGYNIHVIPTCSESCSHESRETESDDKNLCEMSKKRKLNGSLDSFVIKKTKDEHPGFCTGGTWTEYNEGSIHMYNTTNGLKGNEQIAGFDMDSTLIIPASGKKWPQNKDDWKFLFAEVPVKLRLLHLDGYKIVIFTNQAGISKGTVKASDIKQKIEAVISRLKIPAQAIICTASNGYYRKPAPGMWEYISAQANDGVSVNVSKSLYVGDGAGRVAGWSAGSKKDIACSDRLFAITVGVAFHTPEAFFQGCKEGAFQLPEFDPRQAISSSIPLLEPESAQLTSGQQEVVVMVGFPSSGKSYFSCTHLSGYERVNRDKLGSWQKCVARCEQMLKAGKSVVVDNTNPDIESRARYVNCAKQNGVPVRCFVMTTSYRHARHNEKYRQMVDKSHAPINEMIVHAYKKKYEEPKLGEGFAEIVKVNSIPTFDSDDKKRLYSLHLLDK